MCRCSCRLTQEEEAEFRRKFEEFRRWEIERENSPENRAFVRKLRVWAGAFLILYAFCMFAGWKWFDMKFAPAQQTQTSCK